MKTVLSCLSLLIVCLFAIADDAKPKMDGTWTLSKGVHGGMDIPEDLAKSIKLTIKGNEYEVSIAGQTVKGTATPDDTTTPKRMKLKDSDGPNAGKTIHAIYELNKDEMKVCYAMEGTEYPKEFKAPEGSNLFYAVYKRSK